MPVAKSPLSAAFRVGGVPVLGFLIHTHDGFRFGEAELIYGPPSTCKQLGVRRPLKDCVVAAYDCLFGDVQPALTSLEVCLAEPLPEDLLEGKREGGRKAFTVFHTRGERHVVTFSPKLGTREVVCLGEASWRMQPISRVHWYSIGQLRPWFAAPLPATECERRIAAYFETSEHREFRTANKTDATLWQEADGSAKLLGSTDKRPKAAWRLWGLRGYWLLPDGGARDRDGSLVPEASLAQIAKEELLPWPGAALDWRPSEADAECLFRPLDQDTTSALVRLQRALRTSPHLFSKVLASKVDLRLGRVVWLLTRAGPRLALILGHAPWSGGSEKSGLLLKALPTTSDWSGGALPVLPEAAQLSADIIAPAAHVQPFPALLNLECCRPSRRKRRRPPEEIDAAPEGKRFPGAPLPDAPRQAGLEGEDAKQLLAERDLAFVAPRGGEAPPSAVTEPYKPGRGAVVGEDVSGEPPGSAEGEGALGKRKAVASSSGAAAKGPWREEEEPVRLLRPSEVPERRGEVLEALRRVLRLVKQDPEEFWGKQRPGEPFPFPELLPAMRAEQVALKAGASSSMVR